MFSGDFAQWPENSVTAAALVYAFVVLFVTSAEILFAAMFFVFRSQQEESDHVYFASDDPKWIIINRVTLTVVIAVMSHLLWQSFFMLKSAF